MAPRLAETTHTAEIEIPARKTTRVRVDDPMIQLLEMMRTENRLSDRKGTCGDRGLVRKRGFD